jgi:hypothetical protein
MLPRYIEARLRAVGVPAQTFDSDLGQGSVTLLGNHRFEFAEPGDGVPALLHQVRDGPDCDVIDIVASIKDTVASYLGAAFCLGQDQLFIPPSDDPLHVHVTALDWLHAGRRGIVIIERSRTFAMLQHRSLLAAATEEHAAALRELLVPPKLPRVEVSTTEDRKEFVRFLRGEVEAE